MTLALAGLVAVAGVANGQAPSRQTTPYDDGKGSSTKSLLEQTLEAAAKSNPDLRVALAKLAEAEAEVARTRLRVIQKVVAAYQEVEKARLPVKEAERRIQDIVERSAYGEKDPNVTRRRSEMAPLKQKLAAAEAELDYLLGKPAAREKSGLFRHALNDPNATSLALLRSLDRDAGRPEDLFDPFGRRTVSPAGPTADRLRKALDQNVSVKFSDVTARQALQELKALAPGLHVQAPSKGEAWNEKVTAELTNVPLGAVLQLLEDVLTGHRIVVREYGLFIVPQEKVPPGAMPLGEFWRGGAKAERPGATSTPR
jgi:hypothetical protein